MCRGLGENARAPARGRHHLGRVAGGPGDFQEVSPGDLPAGCGAFEEVPAYLIDGRPLLDQALTLFVTSLAHFSVASRT
jgi:hypothetical protein